jgi:hypothetical protein
MALTRTLFLEKYAFVSITIETHGYSFEKLQHKDCFEPTPKTYSTVLGRERLENLQI